MWHVCFFNYNVPPCLTIKNFFIMMILLIYERNSITTTNIDIMLAPLIQELLECWNLGIVCFDANREEVFASRTMINWCLHDYHAFTTLAGVSNKGHLCCPICGSNTPNKVFVENSLCKVK